jgi:hypothetical protein
MVWWEDPQFGMIIPPTHYSVGAHATWSHVCLSLERHKAQCLTEATSNPQLYKLLDTLGPGGYKRRRRKHLTSRIMSAILPLLHQCMVSMEMTHKPYERGTDPRIQTPYRVQAQEWHADDGWAQLVNTVAPFVALELAGGFLLMHHTPNRWTGIASRKLVFFPMQPCRLGRCIWCFCLVVLFMHPGSRRDALLSLAWCRQYKHCGCMQLARPGSTAPFAHVGTSSALCASNQ